MTPQQHLDWLKQCIQPPYTNGWWEWAKHRADELAAANPECAHLPAELKAERERIKVEALSARTSSASEAAGTPDGNCSTVGS